MDQQQELGLYFFDLANKWTKTLMQSRTFVLVNGARPCGVPEHCFTKCAPPACCCCCCASSVTDPGSSSPYFISTAITPTAAPPPPTTITTATAAVSATELPPHWHHTCLPLNSQLCSLVQQIGGAPLRTKVSLFSVLPAANGCFSPWLTGVCCACVLWYVIGAAVVVSLTVSYLYSASLFITCGSVPIVLYQHVIYLPQDTQNWKGTTWTNLENAIQL